VPGPFLPPSGGERAKDRQETTLKKGEQEQRKKEAQETMKKVVQEKREKEVLGT
jgi:hypothetical protein